MITYVFTPLKSLFSLFGNSCSVCLCGLFSVSFEHLDTSILPPFFLVKVPELCQAAGGSWANSHTLSAGLRSGLWTLLFSNQCVELENKSSPKSQFSCRLHRMFLQDFSLLLHINFALSKPLKACCREASPQHDAAAATTLHIGLTRLQDVRPVSHITASLFGFQQPAPKLWGWFRVIIVRRDSCCDLCQLINQSQGWMKGRASKASKHFQSPASALNYNFNIFVRF